MQKLPIGYYFGAMVVSTYTVETKRSLTNMNQILWGITTTTTAATTSFATLCINRVFLGVFEACMAPILTILVGQYWTRSEHPLRSACWFAGSPIGSFIADAITYGVSDNRSANSAKWVREGNTLWPPIRKFLPHYHHTPPFQVNMPANSSEIESKITAAFAAMDANPCLKVSDAACQFNVPYY